MCKRCQMGQPHITSESCEAVTSDSICGTFIYKFAQRKLLNDSISAIVRLEQTQASSVAALRGTQWQEWDWVRVSPHLPYNEPTHLMHDTKAFMEMVDIAEQHCSRCPLTPLFGL